MIIYRLFLFYVLKSKVCNKYKFKYCNKFCVKGVINDKSSHVKDKFQLQK